MYARFLPLCSRITSEGPKTAFVNSVCLSLIWTCAPILVSVTAFFTYIATGNELTIGTAFTVGLRYLPIGIRAVMLITRASLLRYSK